MAAAASAYWDRRAGGETSVYWAEHEPVRLAVNRWITGEPTLWPVDALATRWLPERQRSWPRFWRALSIGCGVGNLERALRRARLCWRAEAYDVSPASIAEAERRALAESVRGIRYRVADCDRLVLPRRRYGLACFHHSLHHIADPDRLLDQVHRSLRPGGYLYVDEYVGPSRDEWTEATLHWAAAAYDEVEPELRSLPLAPPIDPADPSEMIRASRILPAIHERFEVVLERPYWGNLLFPLLAALDGSALRAPEHRARIEDWVERERRLVAAGAITAPLFAVLLARKA